MTFSSWGPSRRFGAVFAALMAASLLWVFASPLSSVPDEPAHMVKAAAVARGELGGTPSEGSLALEVTVPRWVADAHLHTCYAFDPQVTPACAADDLWQADDLVSTPTTAGKYNPVYYALVGWPSVLLTGETAYYAMRIVSALLSCVFLAAAITPLLSDPRRRFAAVGALVTVTPMVLFLNGAVNPNSLEVATTASFFVALVAALRTPAGQRIALSTIVWVVVSAALLANTRAASLMWMLVAVVVVVILTGWGALTTLVRRPAVLVGAGIIALATIGSLAWTLTRGTLESQPFEGAGMSVFGGLIVMLERTFDYMLGLVGYFGWVDTPAPSFVLIVWTLAAGTLLLTSLVLARGRSRVAVIVAALAYLLLPAISQAVAVPSIGFIWQGRYNLALFVIVLLVVGYALDESPLTWTATTRRLVRIGIVLAAAAHLYAWLWAMRRYVTGLGLNHPWWDMILRPAWQPPLGWPTWFALAIVVFGLSAWALWRWAGDDRLDSVAPARAVGADTSR